MLFSDHVPEFSWSLIVAFSRSKPSLNQKFQGTEKLLFLRLRNENLAVADDGNEKFQVLLYCIHSDKTQSVVSIALS